MTFIQHRLLAVLMVAMLCPVSGVSGGAKRQGRALRGSVPPVSACCGLDQAVVDQQTEMAALDASADIPWTGYVRQKAKALFARLKERRIAVQPTFYKRLGKTAPGQRGRLVSRCQVFFDNVDTQEISNTSCLTSMIRKQIGSFLLHNHDSIRRVAKTPALRSLSSMFSSRGFPQVNEDIQAFMEREVWWQGKGETRTLDRKLLRTFSSMFNGRGLPDKKAVDDYLQLDVWWQGRGATRRLDRELLRTFSSMFSSKGLPDQKTVDDYLKWDIWWQGQGQTRTLDRELLRTFSAMFSGKGVPEQQVVDDYLQLDAWWQGEGDERLLDRGLLRAFSSMFHHQGLPDIKTVKDYLQWEIWWQGEGKAHRLDRELLRVFSSMFNGKGIPDKQVVDNYLKWEVWWQGEGKARTLDRELLRTFSSMCSGRGLPDKQAVEDYLQLDVWWQGEGAARTLDRRLLRSFSSMFARRGLPNKKAVEDYLKWKVWWQGEGEARSLDRKLLRAFSSMFHGKGLPDKRATDEILKWLACEQEWHRQAVQVMADLYSGAYAGHGALGLPDLNKLRQAEQNLMALIPPQERAQDEDNDIPPLIKIVALYLANEGGARQLHWSDCEAWLREHPRPRVKKILLKQLLRTLRYHGGQGIKEAVALISGKPAATKWFVLDALSSGEALIAVQYALQVIDPSEWREYVSFTRGLLPLPSAQQWRRLKGNLEALALILPSQAYRCRFLTLIWPCAPADRERFMQPESVARLTTLLPSIQVMRNLSKSLTTDELRTLFHTYLSYRAGRPDKQALSILFKGLLLAQLPLFDREALPPGVLAQTCDQPKGVVIRVNPAIGVEDSVTLFLHVMAALLGELWDCEYTVDEQTLTLWPHGETVPITFPTPSLVWHPDGVQIQHWTSAHLDRFYRATECWHGLYREPVEPHDGGPEATRSRTEPRSADAEQPAERPMAYLTVAMLRGILKNRVPMNPIAWASADYHKEKLSPSLVTLLKERVDGDRDGLVPESLKTFLSACDQQSQIVAPHSQSAAPNQCSPHPSAVWLETVLRQSVLSEADIDQLYTYRDQLTCDHVVDVLFRMAPSVSRETERRWQLLLGEKHKQTLAINPPWLDGSDDVLEGVRDIEDMLRDLFPDDWS